MPIFEGVHRFELLVVTTLVILGNISAQALAGNRDDILAAYQRADRATSELDADGVIRDVLPTWYVQQKNGVRHTYDEQRLQLLKNFTRPANVKVFTWRSLTNIERIEFVGDKAIVQGTTHAEHVVVNAAGAKSDGKAQSTFVDEWMRTPSGWRLSYTRVLSDSSHISGVPSLSASSQRQAPSLRLMQSLLQLQQMRNMNNQLRGFNSQNNYSYCMSSNGMQQFGYPDRQVRCSN